MKEKSKETLYAITKGGLSAIPGAGGIISELFGVVVADPASKRREELLVKIDTRLIQLEEQGIDIEALRHNEEFLSVILQSYQIAIRTHQKEKIESLLNAVSNTPASKIDDNMKHMFLMFIDSFTEWHLRILEFVNNPRKYYDESPFHMGGRSSLLEMHFPELKDRRSFYDQVIKDLYSRGLVSTDSLHTVVTGNGMLQSLTTELGRDFINFITMSN
jgi:hypothetical protein